VPEVQVLEGACEDILPTLTQKFKLVFADPPFNNDTDYGGEPGSDDLSDQHYLDWCRKWIFNSARLLTDDGHLWLHISDAYAADFVNIGKRECQMRLRNWIIWHYRFGFWQPNRFINSKAHGLWFNRRGPMPEINVEEALVPSLRASLYDDPRSTTGQRMDLDVWGFEKYWGRVQGNSAERRPLHPNQLPELYLSRIIRVCTNPGDWVLDPFCGSGTTATVAAALGRNCITIEKNPEFAASARERIAAGSVRVVPAPSQEPKVRP
jgi:site-specific DNA-methyltransferase (adenine-specific)